MKTFKFLSIFLCVIIFSACRQEYKEKLVGTWVETYNFDGLTWQMNYTFDKSGEFSQSLIPLDDTGVGFSMAGIWDIDAKGELRLKYELNSLEPLLGNHVSHEDPIILEVLNDATKLMNDNNDENWFYIIEFINDNKMELSSSLEKDIFDRVR